MFASVKNAWTCALTELAMTWEPRTILGIDWVSGHEDIDHGLGLFAEVMHKHVVLGHGFLKVGD